MNRKKISHKTPQWGTFAVIGAGIVAPVLSLSNPVEADPVRYAQVRNQNTTHTGVVTQNLLGREFRMRTSNGADLRVIFAAGQEPRALSVGDRIRISGRQTSGLFVASSLAILSQGRNNAGTASQNTTLTGVVTQNLAGREFRMRTSSGVDQRVVFAAGQKPRALSVGDRVRVSGRQTSGLFVASNLAILSNIPVAGAANRRMDFTGTVMSVQNSNRLVVHVNNVGSYQVQSRTRLASAITSGDIVRVVGRGSGNNVVQADRVILVRNGTATPSANNARVNITGTVFSVASANRLVVHVNNVGDFQVQSRNRLSSAITVGDIVRVVGWRSGNTVQADQVVLVRNGTVRNDGDWDDDKNSTTLTGTVTQDLNGAQFLLRSDKGRTTRVITHVPEPRGLSVGDRVEVGGRLENGVFLANRVRILNDANRTATPSANNARVNLTGTVSSVGSANRLVVHVNNVGDFQVQSRNRLSSAITVGDIVRVVGWRSGNTVQADQVILVRNNANRVPTSNSTQVSGQNVNFAGTVLSVTRVFGAVGDLQVRGDNGQVYRVRVKNATSFQNGNRVRVIGTVNKGSINASSVTRL